MRGTTIGRRIYNPNNFLTNPTLNHSPIFSSSSPFSTSSGRRRGAGHVGSPPGGQFEHGAETRGKPDLDESKTESSELQPSGIGHGRGKPVGTGSVLPSFSTFISSVKNSQPGAGRGRGITEPGPSRLNESRPDSEPPKKAEANLLPSILSGLGGTRRGKPAKQEVLSEPAKEENKHLRTPTQPQPRTRNQKTPDGDDAVPAMTKMGRQAAVKKAMELLSRGGGEGEVGGRGGRGSFVPGRGGARGGARGGGGGRGRGRGRGRRGYGDKEAEYGSGMSLEGHEEDEEKFAQSVGVETMNTLAEAFEEISGRVLPCPVEDEYVNAFDTNCSFELEPEYLMGEFDKNPDIDEKPPMPLRDALEKVKPFMIAYMGIKTHEEWEEIVEETMKDAPLMKKIVDSYSEPDRVSAKKQKEELERVAKTISASAPDSVKSFADRAVLSLQDNFLKMKLGGVHDCKGFQNSAKIDSLARFAVQEHNKKENAFLKFVRVLKAKEEVVAGKLYHLTVEATDAGNNKMYEVKVWVKPWMNFKQLQEFKHVEGDTSTDLGVKPDDHGSGWQMVPTNDLEVQDAANHAVNSIQKRSNSLYPYELLEILLAKAKVIEDYAKFNPLLKLRRGIKEETFKFEVTKNTEGKFYVNLLP